MSIGEDGDVVSIDNFWYLFLKMLVDIFLGGCMVERMVEFDFEVVVVVVGDSYCAILARRTDTSGSTSTA